MGISKPVPNRETHLEAKRNPKGLVYAISARYAYTDEIPAEGVIGFWQVDKDGNLIDDFTFNISYDQEHEISWWSSSLT